MPWGGHEWGREDPTPTRPATKPPPPPPLPAEAESSSSSSSEVAWAGGIRSRGFGRDAREERAKGTAERGEAEDKITK